MEAWIVHNRQLESSTIVYHGANGEVDLSIVGGSAIRWSVKLADANWYRVLKLKVFEPYRWYHVAATWTKGKSWKYTSTALYESPRQFQMPTYETLGHLICPQSALTVEEPVLGSKQTSYSGVIDEVRLWTRARSASEIQSTIHRSLLGSEDDLVGYWTFETNVDGSVPA